MKLNMSSLSTSKLLRNSLIIGSLIFSGQILNVENTAIPAAMAKGKAAPGTQEISLVDYEKPSSSEETINGKCFCVSRILIKASPAQVWRILTDYKHAVQVFPLLKKCEVLEDRGTTKISRHEIAPSGIPDTFEYILEVHENAPKTMEWHRLSGDFKEVDGSWKLEPVNLGHHTLVTYASHVNGGFFMPQMIIKHQAHIDMPSTLIALKKHTEQSIEIASRRTDSSNVQTQ